MQLPRLDGLPLVRNYLPRDYHASPQNWSVLQDGRGMILVGNTEGLLEYDGVKWRLHEVPNGVVRSLTMDDSETVFVGGMNEFGYLKNDLRRGIRYHSLVNILPDKERDFGDVWSLAVNDSNLFVQTFTHIFVIPIDHAIDGDSIKTGRVVVFRSASTFFPACFLRDTLFVTEKNTGLLKVAGTHLIPVPGGEIFEKDIVYLMLPYPGEKKMVALVATLKQGLFLYDGTTFQPFATEADQYFKDFRLYLSGLLMADGSYLLGTQLGGAVVMDARGHVRAIIDKASGLKNQTVWHSFLDREGGLWLALDDGLARIETPFTVSVFNESIGLEGRPGSLSFHDGSMFISSGSGVFYLESSSSPKLSARFRKVSGINVQSWSLSSAHGRLMAATSDGVSTIEGFKAKQVGGSLPYSYSILPMKQDANVLFIGRHDGISQIRWDGTSWIGLRDLPRINDPILLLAEGPEGVVWAASFNRKFFRVSPGIATTEVREISGMTGLSVTGIQFDEHGGKILCSTNRGLRIVDASTGALQEAGIYSALADSGCNIRAMAKGEDEEIWLLLARDAIIELGTLNLQTGDWRSVPESYVLQGLIEGYPSSLSFDLLVQDGNSVWISGGETVIRIGLPITHRADGTVRTFIRSVLHADSIIVPGPGLKGVTLEFLAGTSLQFDFALASFLDPERSEYQFRLEGFDAEWSSWSSQTRKEYTNLSAGAHAFEVRGKRADGIVGETASFAFVVLRPWYLTTWALLSYTVLSLVLVWLAVNLRVRVLTKRTMKLESVVAERTAQVVEQKTQIEEQARRLVELDEVKSRFFANISHEFRTPLTLILGQIENVLENLQGTRVREKLETAARNGRRLHRLINQLLDVARLESGNTRLDKKTANLVALCRNRFFGFESLAEQKTLVMRFEHSQESIVALVDKEKIIEVVDNLLSNAIKFTMPNGTVRMSVSSDHLENATIVVADTGVGIPESELPLVFDRFHQVDASHTRENEGSGLGLAIARELVCLHGGEISVTSRVGKGTEFQIILPRGTTETGSEPESVAFLHIPEEQNILSEPTEHQLVPPIDAAGRAVILIVEDNADMQEYIRDNLDLDCVGIVASNGEEGLARAFSDIPDLIITDVMMPRMDGVEMSRLLREDARTCHIPIVMLTAKATEEGRMEGLEAGVDDYLTKPFSPRELRVRVGNLLRIRSLMRQRFSRVALINPREVTDKSLDQQFLEKTLDQIKAHLEESSFGVQTLAGEVGMSVSQLNRKLNALIGQSAGKLIRSGRLELAAGLLVRGAGGVADIAYRLGFADQASFTRSFRAHFYCTPTEYKRRKENAEREGFDDSVENRDPHGADDAQK